MTPQVFALPDLGEGLTDAELVRWLVAPGDAVAVDQPIAEVETAKAAVELPTPYAGTVLELHGSPGDTIEVGAPVITVSPPTTPPDAAASGPDTAAPTSPDAVPAQPVPTQPGPAQTGPAQSGPGPEGRGPGTARAGSGAEGNGGFREPGVARPETSNVLVGFGPRDRAPASRAARRRALVSSGAPTAPGTPAAGTSPEGDGSVPTPPGPASGAVAVVSPLVRRLARENGVDVAAVRGSGPDGLVLRRDVEAAIAPVRDRPRTTEADAPETGGPGTAGPGTDAPETADPVAGAPETGGPETGAPETAGPVAGGPVAGSLVADAPETGCRVAGGPVAGGPETGGPVAAAPVAGGPVAGGPVVGGAGARRVPLKGIRGRMAEHMARSRREIPEATVWVDADATELLAVRDAANARDPEHPVTLLGLLARFCVSGLARYPELNARVDTAAREVVLEPRVHLGFAAQTARGLVVPVAHDAHTRTARALSAELRALTVRARDGALTPADLTGGTFTVNNYGVFGVDGSAAIINHPEVAILGMGRIMDRPWAVDGAPAVRKVTELTLSFDHRACDGGTAGGFLRYVADCVERPSTLVADV